MPPPDDSSSSSSAFGHIDEAEPLLRRPSAFYSNYEATSAAQSSPHPNGELPPPIPPPPPPQPSLPHSASSLFHPHGEILRSVEYDTFPEDVTFGRNISWLSAYMLIISRMIGSGIFATPGVIFKSVGSVGLSLLLWVVGAAISACGLGISLELGCMLPRSGGTKVYLEFIYRRPRFLASTLYAVNAVLLGFTASNAIVFSRYILFAFNAEQDLGGGGGGGSGGAGFAQKTIAVLMLTVITIIHGCFLKTGIMLQNALGWAKILVVLIMLFASLVAFLRGAGLSGSGSGSGLGSGSGSGSSSGSAPTVNFLSWEEIWQGSNWRWGVVSTAIFKVSYSYAGYDNVNNVMNEVKDPIKTLKTAAPAALLTISIFYLLLNLAYFSVLPVEEVRSSGELIAALFFQKLFGRGPAQTLLPLLIAVSAFGNVMVVTFALARVNQEIARQGFLPFSGILSSSRPFNAPLGGLIVHYIPSVLVVTLPPPGDVYAFILDVKGYPGQFFSLAVSIGLLLLRRSRPELTRPFRAWLVAVYLRIGMSLALLASPFVQPPKDGKGDVGFWYGTYAVVGTGILVFAVIYWYLWTVAVPRWRGYRLEEEVDVLEDGTSITKLIKVKDD